MKRRVKKVYKKLPPHTNEAHPVANAGEASKPLIIGIIAIVAVVALSLLLLFSNQFVGKAVYPGQAGTAGLVYPIGVYENNDFTVQVKANVGSELAAGVNFELTLPSGVSCKSLVDNFAADVGNFTCDSTNKVTYVGGKTKPVSGELLIASITVSGVPAATYNFQFAKFDVKQADKTLISFSNNVLASSQLEVVKAPSATCIDNVKNGQETDVDCGPGCNACANDKACSNNNDCTSNNCVSNICKSVEQTPQLQCVNSPSGLVSWWTGESNSAGDVLSKNSGTPKGGLGYVAGKVGNAFNLDGVDDYYEIADDPSLTPAAMTVMAWVNLAGGNAAIMSKYSVASPSSWSFVVSGGQLRFTIESSKGQSRITTNNEISKNQWHHVVAVYDSANKLMKMYVNGVEASSTLLSSSAFAPPFDSTIPVRIGAAIGEDGVAIIPFKGLIDEVAFWNRALTAQEVKSIYDAGSAGMCKVTPTPKTFSCIGSIPANAKLCTGDDSGLTLSTDNKLVSSCTNEIKCEYTCNTDYALQNGVCQKTPTPVLCGNGVIDVNLGEQCDDKNTISGDGCSSTCQKEQQQQLVCGDGKKEGTEQCDDGNTNNNDGCTNSCMVALIPPACGNGVKEGTEQCDDGNTVTGDGCSSTCQKEQQQPQPVCGDGKKEGTEQCDDGNTNNNDGCTNSCMIALIPPSTTTTGTKITLTNADTANDFATTITATEAFTTEVTVYTVLYGANDKVLSIKSEKIVGGLTKLQTYTATVNYAKANIKKKSVLVFDKKQGPEVFGQLVKEYPT